MRHSTKPNRLARLLRRLLRSERGDVLPGIIWTSAGVLAVSQTLPPLRDAFNTAGDALRNQAGVLARGSDTGSTGGSSGSSGSGGSGFDIGQVTSAAGTAFEMGSKFLGELGNQSGSKSGSASDNKGQSDDDQSGSTPAKP